MFWQSVDKILVVLTSSYLLDLSSLRLIGDIYQINATKFWSIIQLCPLSTAKQCGQTIIFSFFEVFIQCWAKFWIYLATFLILLGKFMLPWMSKNGTNILAIWPLWHKVTLALAVHLKWNLHPCIISIAAAAAVAMSQSYFSLQWGSQPVWPDG